MRTLLVGDEPRDIVFAGTGGNRAFITTAHRGQNRPGDPQLTTPGVGRADVWVFDATSLGPTSLGGTPLSILTLFGDTPRALAVSPDGSTVYAAVFHSGNRTTTISEGAVCDGGAARPPCSVFGSTMPGGLPAPNANFQSVAGPETGLIVRFDPVAGTGRTSSAATGTTPSASTSPTGTSSRSTPTQPGGERRRRSPASAPSSSTWSPTR